MKVIIDERETKVYENCYQLINTEGNNTFIQLSKEVLPLGDIIFMSDDDHPVLIIERKSISDLLSSIKDGRYEEQSYRLKHSDEFPPHNVIYLIEGDYYDRKISDRKLITSIITSLQYFKGFSVMKTKSIKDTSELIMYMADKIDREFQKGKLPFVYKWRNITTIPPINKIPLINEIPINKIPINKIPINKIPINEIPINEIPINEIPINEINVTETNIIIQEKQIVEEYCSVVKKVKKENITKDNIGSIILCQIPGISSVTALSIMNCSLVNGSFTELIKILQTNPYSLQEKTLDTTKPKQRKIGKKTIDNILALLDIPLSIN